MEKKKMNELTHEEKVELLNHWLMYYGKVPVTLDCLEKIRNLIEKETDKIMSIALLNYAVEEGSTPLINAVSSNRLDELSSIADELVKDAKRDADKTELYEELEEHFLGEVFNTYNNPEPPVPMDLGQILSTVLGFDVERKFDSQEEELMELHDKVNQLFFDSLLTEDEVREDAPVIPYILTEGIRANFVFNAERINKNKKDIISILEKLPLDSEVSFTRLCLTKDGGKWTGFHSDVEKIVTLGIATGVLSYTTPRDVWIDTCGVPNIIMNKDMLEKEVEGRNPSCFVEDTKKYVKRKESE